MVQQFLAMAIEFAKIQEKQCAEFSKRKEEARQRYWDACKYPRKKKKKIRKEAKSDFYLYSVLAQPLEFDY